ncbi:MAG TPA: nucleotide sugar dehydrogenase, partial [Clostridiales bacterium]|nr:nucleotide sugar dehydrogenase [Clostridiales bacterium]
MKNEIIISVVGLGYVGLPLAVHLAEGGFEVIGFDLNEDKIKRYINGEDCTNEIGSERLKKIKNITFTSDIDKLKKANFHIVAVPTPVNEQNIPDVEPLIKASELIGVKLKQGDIVVYESTVYPGVTEDICVPVLEKTSGLEYKKQFSVGYSPERINCGDKVHTVDKIVKIVSASDGESLEVIKKVYGRIIKAGLYEASSIKVAEAAKVIENSQRDINIGFMNEIAVIFDKLGIDTYEVLKAAGTKWNFLKFTPGLVGGHCIGVDPYYLIHKAKEVGINPKLIEAAREINNSIGTYIAEKTMELLLEYGHVLGHSRVLLLGLTFKENVGDLRNSRSKDVYDKLKEKGVEVIISDPYASSEEVKAIYGKNLTDMIEVRDADAIVICTAHKEYVDLELEDLQKL